MRKAHKITEIKKKKLKTKIKVIQTIITEYKQYLYSITLI